MINYRVLNDDQMQMYKQEAFNKLSLNSDYFSSIEWAERRVLIFLGTENQSSVVDAYIKHLEILILDKCEKL